MIEIYRKGFRLDIGNAQVVTLKKSVNLNGVQSRYAYSNNFTIEKTSNNKKLLGLPEYPTGKVTSLQDGYEVDVIINSIFLRNQKLQIAKESKEKIDIYILYSDAELITILKKQYLNNVVEEFKYNKTIEDFLIKSDFTGNPIIGTALVQTQSDERYVIEEMPLLINVQKLLKKIFVDNSYAVYGDFFDNPLIAEYYIAPNSGIYQVYSGIGFSPNFDKALTSFEFLNNVLAFFNCYAEFNEENKSVVVNQWSNLERYKDNFEDYSKYFIDYQDYTFQSKLSKRNDLKYSGGDDLYNSFFTNNLSSEESSTYLDSKFGSGSTKTFKDSEDLRNNGELGEVSSVRIYKLSALPTIDVIYQEGIANNIGAKKAESVSMRTVYADFHKGFTDFILSPIIQNIDFKYNSIFAANFSLTKVFFTEQLSSYWIPLEINFSTKQDKIAVRAMMVQRKKVLSPILNNFNSVFLDFREKAIFPKSFLLQMYPMPPNEYEWDEIIFKSYDQDKNSLYVNNILVPAATLPQAFNLSALGENAIVFEANKVGDTIADTDTDSFYIQAVDTNGGYSNDAYITVRHTGIARLESNFVQVDPFLLSYNVDSTSSFKRVVNVCTYVVGNRPNINDTITSLVPQNISGISSNSNFDMVSPSELYNFLKFKIKPFSVRMRTQGSGKTFIRLYVSIGTFEIKLREWTLNGNSDQTFNDGGIVYTHNPFVAINSKVRVFFTIQSDSQAGGYISEIKKFSVDISTVKNI